MLNWVWIYLSSNADRILRRLRDLCGIKIFFSKERFVLKYKQESDLSFLRNYRGEFVVAWTTENNSELISVSDLQTNQIFPKLNARSYFNRQKKISSKEVYSCLWKFYVKSFVFPFFLCAKVWALNFASVFRAVSYLLLKIFCFSRRWQTLSPSAIWWNLRMK